MLIETLGQFAVAQRGRALPPDVTHAAVRTVVDWFAATLPGAAMEPARLLAATLGDEVGGGRARLVLDGRAVPARTAALINGTAAHSAELDDIYRDGIYHPGAPTIAAALAVAEARGADGATFLRALAVGYEIGDRIAEAVNPAHYRFWHTTGTVGAIGAAAAVAELLALDAPCFAHALATATGLGAGLQQAFRAEAMSKPLHAGHAAEAGLLAALAAESGFTGALNILEGEAGFGRAMGNAARWETVTAGLGAGWRIARTTVKAHAGCGHTFAPIDAALELRQRGIDPRQIARITVGTYGVGVQVAGNPDPQTAFEAKFSIPFCIATAFVHGAVRLAAFAESGLRDAAVSDLLGRTTLAIDPGFDATFPRQRGATVTVVLTDGRGIMATRGTRKGDPDDPFSDEELRAKFDELAGAVLGAGQAAELAAALWDLPARPSVRDLPYARVGVRA
jgi:2-methylcitrate dehydratase PrpD